MRVVPNRVDVPGRRQYLVVCSVRWRLWEWVSALFFRDLSLTTEYIVRFYSSKMFLGSSLDILIMAVVHIIYLSLENEVRFTLNAICRHD